MFILGVCAWVHDHMGGIGCLPVVHQFVVQRVTGHTFHDVTLSLLIGQGDGWHLQGKPDLIILLPYATTNPRDMAKTTVPPTAVLLQPGQNMGKSCINAWKSNGCKKRSEKT